MKGKTLFALGAIAAAIYIAKKQAPAGAETESSAGAFSFDLDDFLSFDFSSLWSTDETEYTIPDWLLDDINFNDPGQPRGIRNNNPGNIERTSDRWQGMSSDQSNDDRFIIFDAPEYGIRALAKLLQNYQRIYGLNTIGQIIGRWAPSHENDTRAYAHHVAERLGVGVDQQIDVSNYLAGLVEAIILHENGQQPYSDDLINYGVSLV